MGAGFEMYVMPCWGLMWFMSDDDCLIYSRGLYDQGYIGKKVSRQLVYGHFVYDTSSTDISSTDISSTTVYQRTGQLYIQLLFQQIIIFINSNFYLHYDSF